MRNKHKRKREAGHAWQTGNTLRIKELTKECEEEVRANEEKLILSNEMKMVTSDLIKAKARRLTVRGTSDTVPLKAWASNGQT